MRSIAYQFPRYRRVYCVQKTKKSRKSSCLFASVQKKKLKKTSKRKCTKNFAWCGQKNFPRATKVRIFMIKKCDWKNLEKNENAVSESSLEIPAESMEDAEREDDGEYCGESWQRLKGRTIILGETLSVKRLSAGRDLPRKRKLQSNKEVYCYPTACICDRTFSLKS